MLSLFPLISLALSVSLLVPSCDAHAQGADLQALIFQAIKTGSTKGSISGEIASIYQKQFASNAPVIAEITTITQFKRKDCRRLNVKITMPGVLIKDKQGRDHPVDTNTAMNVCSDGLPPSKDEM